jgi:hypothetical protein
MVAHQRPAATRGTGPNLPAVRGPPRLVVWALRGLCPWRRLDLRAWPERGNFALDVEWIAGVAWAWESCAVRPGLRVGRRRRCQLVARIHAPRLRVRTALRARDMGRYGRVRRHGDSVGPHWIGGRHCPPFTLWVAPALVSLAIWLCLCQLCVEKFESVVGRNSPCYPNRGAALLRFNAAVEPRTRTHAGSACACPDPRASPVAAHVTFLAKFL